MNEIKILTFEITITNLIHHNPNLWGTSWSYGCTCLFLFIGFWNFEKLSQERVDRRVL